MAKKLHAVGWAEFLKQANLPLPPNAKELIEADWNKRADVRGVWTKVAEEALAALK